MKVFIKNFEWEIIEVGDEDKAFFNEDDNLQLYGQTIYEKQLIKIYKDLPYIRKRETLIHELTHAFYDTYLSSQHIKDKFDEEDICCFMGTYAEDIIRIANDYFFTPKDCSLINIKPVSSDNIKLYNKPAEKSDKE